MNGKKCFIQLTIHSEVGFNPTFPITCIALHNPEKIGGATEK
jgi:hypothetical protein